MNAKRARRTPPGWSSSQLTPSLKQVKNSGSLEHIGIQEKHLKDQLAARAFLDRQVLKDAGIPLPDLDTGLASTQGAADISSSTRDQAELERSVDEALAERGVLLTLGYLPMEGNRLNGRKWSVLPGNKWVAAMQRERSWRACYRDRNYNHLERPDLAMEAQYCRLPPWLAALVRKRLAANTETASELMVELAKRFGDRFGVDVIGIGLHSENGQDWHVHLLFSRSIEEITEKPAGLQGRKEKSRLNGILRTELKAAGKPATPKAVAEAVKAAIAAGRFADPQSDIQKIEYVRRSKAKNEFPLRVWGPAYRNKYWICSAADGEDRERVAAANDRPSTDPGGFRWWLQDLAFRDNSPEEHFSDVWAESEWQEICRGVLSPTELQKVEALRRDAVRSYLALGTSMPTPMEAMAAHLKRERAKAEKLEADVAEIRRELADTTTQKNHWEKLRMEAEKRAKELLAENNALREEELRRVEQDQVSLAAMDAAMATVPEEFRRGTPQETLQILGETVRPLRRLVAITREFIHRVFKGEIASPRQFFSEVRKMASEFGIREPKREKGPEIE